MEGDVPKKRYDVVIFGATGFTGQFVVKELVRTTETEPGLTWAVAGRTMDKLQKVLTSTTGKDSDSVPVIIADVSSYQSLLDMCQQAKVVINCVGPFNLYGEQVIKACIESKASHVDISGEPSYLEKTQLLYTAKAREAGVYIVGSCGFDSIPAEMGVVFTKKNFDGDLNSIECFVSCITTESIAVNYGTFESAVHGFSMQGELATVRKTLFPTPLPRSNHKLQKRSLIFFSEEVNKWCLPFPGSDRSVVNRTQRFNFDVKKERPVQFSPYICFPSFLSAMMVALFAIIFGIMTKFGFTRNLLLKYPSFFTNGVFTKQGPTKKQIESTSVCLTFIGRGYSKKLDDPSATHDEVPDKTITTKVMGPEPGYVTTPICIVQAALCILKEKDKLPKEGGVYTPGAAFADTDLIDRLTKNNIKFEVVSP
ncbi:saccharopine dehydrogenase-like oxidoreductase [Gigantopelta aegis]|uniref:saccharopine dehydrogenase-like oxidoreductase n=1 Tax=Gigantopelta aegis TaxID=1735272 RepID=UPI001B88B177|nr:saccharopine dehydrogenase-like oxidoreductase [Gigantopelta aegis]